MADEWEDVPGSENPIESTDDGWEDVPGTENPDNKIYDAATGDRDYSDYEYGSFGRWADITGKSIAQGAGRAIEGFGSLLDAGEDALAGDRRYSGYGRDIVDWARPQLQGTEDYLNQELEPGSGEKLYSDVTSGLTGAVPMMATGNIPGAIILGAADRFGQKIAQVEKAGGDDPIGAAATSMVPGTFIDYIQYAPIFNKALTPFKKILQSAGTGLLGTALETPYDMYADTVGGIRETPTMEEIGDEIIARAPAGTITGGVMGATQSGVQGIKDYTSNRAMAAKTGEYAAKIDSLQADRAAADLTARANAEMRTDVPVGDLPSVNEQAAALGQEAPRVFDKDAAAKFANQNAATKMGATEPIPETPINVAKQPDPIKIEKPPTPEIRTGDLASDTMDKLQFEEALLDPHTIGHDPEVPNFKKGANEKGVIKEIPGEITKDQRLPITVRRKLDGSLYVVSGRHRLDIFQRKNEPIKAEIYNEADGFTAEMARIKDAELNIRDGTGTTNDFARYFKFRNLTKDQAVQKGLLATPKGEDGFAIGTMASDEVFARHQYEDGDPGKLSDKQAAIIAKAAPNDAGLQKIGIISALDKGTPPEMLGQVIKSYEIRRMAQAQKTEQGVLFGDEDTAIADAEAATKIAFKEADSLDSQIALGRRAIKDPEAARKFSDRGEGKIDIKNPEAILLEIKKLQIESNRLRNFTKYPELLAEMNMKAGVKPSPSQLQAINDPDLAAKRMLENVSAETVSARPKPRSYDSISEKIVNDSYSHHLEPIAKAEEALKGQILSRPIMNAEPAKGKKLASVDVDPNSETYGEVVLHIRNIDKAAAIKAKQMGLSKEKVLPIMYEELLKHENVHVAQVRRGHDFQAEGRYTKRSLSEKEALAVASDKTLNERLIQFDNSSEVFPAGVEKPFQSDDQVPLIMNKASEIKSGMSNIKDTAGMETITNSSDLKNKIKGKKKKLVQKLTDQKGAVRVDIPNPFKSDGWKTIVSKIRKDGFKQNPEYYNFFKNHKNILARNLTMADKFPFYKKSHEASLKMYERENMLAWDHTESLRPFTLLNAKEKQNVTALMYELNKRGKDFQTTPENLKALELSDREVRGVMSVRKTMDNALEISRAEALKQLEDTPIVASPDAMERAGFKKPEIEKIIMSVKKVEDLQNLIRTKEIEKINNRFNQLKEENYVPTGRYGKYGLALYENGEKLPTAFIMNDNKGKLLSMLQKERASNPNLDVIKSAVSEVPRALGSEYVGIHPDIVSIMNDTNGNIPSTSFLNRFKKRNMIEGFEADLQRNIASYLGSHSRYISGQETKRTFNKLNKEFDAFYETLGNKEKTLNSGLRNEIQKLQNYVMTPQKDGAKLRKFMSTIMLANQVATITVNNLSVLNSMPVINKYLNPESSFTKNVFTPSGLAKNIGAAINPSTEIAFAKAAGQMVNYYRKKTFGEIKGEVGKDLYASLEQARKEGAIGGSNVVRQLLQDADSPRATTSALGQKMSAQDALFFFNSISEDAVRTHTYMTAWNMYDKALPYFEKRGIEAPNKHEFAKRIVDETHANYSKAGTPNAFKGVVGKTASIFKLWPHNFFTGIKNSVLEGNLGAVSRYAGVLGSLGGLYAIPGIREMLLGLKNAGFDPEKKVKELIPGDNQVFEKVVTKGALSLTSRDLNGALKFDLPFFGEIDLAPNVNIRGALSPDIMPKGEGDIFSILGRFAMGATGDIADRAYRGYQYYEKGDVPKMLLQGVPRMMNAQALFKAKMYESEGITDSKGVSILRDDDGNPRPPTTRELARIAAGFMPETVSAANDRNREVYKIANENDNEHINYKLAQKKKRGESTDELVEYARENGINITESSINEYIKKFENPGYADRNRVGKRGLDKLDELNEKTYSGMNE